MKIKGMLIAICAVVAFGASVVRADDINGSSTGLASPAQTITFDEVVLPVNTSLTSQYSALGVTFSPNVFYDPQTGFGNVQGNDIGNFTFSGGGPVNPVTMMFSTIQTGVAFSFDADNTPYLFQAFLGGTLVDSFTATVGVSNDDYYGFSNDVFNQITITQMGTGGGPYWVADNIQTSAVATPEPSSMILLGSGLLSLGGLMRRRQRRN